MNFKSLLSSAISGSKLAKSLKNNEEARQEFLKYLDALQIVNSYKLGRSSISIIRNQFTDLKPNEFVAFLGKNLPESAKVDGASFLSAIERVSKKSSSRILYL